MTRGLPTLMQLLITDNYQEKLSVPGMGFSSLALADKSEGNRSAGVTHDHQKALNFPAWDGTLENDNAGIQLPFQPSFSAAQSDNLGVIQKQEQEPLEQLFPNGFSKRPDFGSHPQVQEEWQVLYDRLSSPYKLPLSKLEVLDVMAMVESLLKTLSHLGSCRSINLGW